MHNPPKGQKKMSFKDIQKIVRKKDGSKPKIGSICDAAKNYKKAKMLRGRPKGCKKTDKGEDKILMETFKKLRPPGHGVDSRQLHKALPKKLKRKISRRTIIRRLADKGYFPEYKFSKSDPGVKQTKKRVDFGKKYNGLTSQQWKAKLKAVGDIKEFTFYPKALRAKFAKLRAPWTYMNKKERKQPAVQRPKRWFPKKDWQKVKKQKVSGFTTSTGKSFAFCIPSPFNGEVWAQLIRTKLAPILKKEFPTSRSKQILLDGEKVFYGPPAKKAMKDNDITVLPGWPKYSPDLNPQENVWDWAEKELRTMKCSSDTFATFGKKCVKAVEKYPGSDKLIGSMAKRMRILVEGQGKNIGK
jgi:hypothetical protein